MIEIKTKEEALELMGAYENRLPLGEPDFSNAMDALADFFMTDEQKAEMEHAEYKYALQIGIDPDFAKFFYLPVR